MIKIILVHDFENELWWWEIHVSWLTILLKEQWNNVVNYYWSSKNKFIYKITAFFNIYHLIKLCFLLYKNKDIKVVHFHWTLYSLSPSIYLIKRFFDIKIIQTIHAFQYYCPRLYWIYEDWSICKYWFNCTRCLYKNCYSYFIGKQYIFWYRFKWLKIAINRFFIRRYVGKFICPSKKLQEYMIKTLNLEETKTLYLPNFIDIERNEYPNYETINNTKFLFVWRLSKVKWIDIAIKSINYLVYKWIKDIYFNIIGDWPEKQRLEKMVINLWLQKNINFLWKINNKELWEYYNNAWAILIPSVCLENNPLVALESMKYGRPIIASNIWWIPDLVEYWKNGYLFQMWNHIELAEKILQLYGNNKKIIEMWKYGFEKLKKEFNSKLFYERLMKVYNE